METMHLEDYYGNKAHIAVNFKCSYLKFYVSEQNLPLDIEVYGRTKEENAELLKKAIMEEAEHLCALVDEEYRRTV